MAKKVNCGVIGLGGFGISYCQALKKIKNAELICVSTRRENVAKKMGEEFGADSYTDYNDMLKRADLDAVFIATPNFIHAEQTIASLEAGKHVLCTKPIATTLRDADDMIKTARRTGLKLEIGYNRRFDQPIVKTKELVDSKKIGEIFYAKASPMEIRPSPGLNIPGRPPYEEYWKWIGKRFESGGGCLLTQHSHELDYMQWFFGAVDWVLGRTENCFHPIEVEDVASAIIKFKNGILLSFNSSTATLSSLSPVYELFGKEGVISASAGNEELKICDRTGKWELVMQGTTDWLDQQVMELSKFINCIIEDKEPFIPAEESRKALEIVLGVYRSSELGRLIKFPLTN